MMHQETAELEEEAKFRIHMRNQGNVDVCDHDDEQPAGYDPHEEGMRFALHLQAEAADEFQEDAQLKASHGEHVRRSGLRFLAMNSPIPHSGWAMQTRWRWPAAS